ncbi:CoiA-like domain protein [Polaromonas sp. YR568]|uniref:competence protein CoiA n=1 Tax=Polaromonas sp. YR568 TaxID=1855301 RepID=UPI003137743C
MQLALVDGVRQKAHPGLKGVCPGCALPAVPKCGEKLVWHWAHKGRHCDPWWENETEWHRNWKAQFPEAWQEVIQTDAVTGEKHIADVRTANGMVIELQHSAMPADELRSREAFYKHMIWIVDARSFASQFEINPLKLPDPKSELCKDAFFFETAAAYWRPSERDPNLRLVLMHQRRDIEEQIQRDYRGHHFYTWKRPRAVWYESTMPVLLDFGTDELYWLQLYDSRGVRCVRRIRKSTLVRINLEAIPQTPASL